VQRKGNSRRDKGRRQSASAGRNTDDNVGAGGIHKKQRINPNACGPEGLCPARRGQIDKKAGGVIKSDWNISTSGAKAGSKHTAEKRVSRGGGPKGRLA